MSLRDEVRSAALRSLDLREEDLGSAVLKVENAIDGWDLLYADSAGTFEGLAVLTDSGEIDIQWEDGEDFEA